MNGPSSPRIHGSPVVAAVLAAGLMIAIPPGGLRAETRIVGADRAPGTAGEVVLKGTIVGRANKERVVEASLTVPGTPIRPGQAATLSMALEIKKGWHINSSRPTFDYLIPTRVEFPEGGAVQVDDIAYPEGHLVALKFAQGKLSVYEGRTVIRPTIRPHADQRAGSLEVRARVTYQACSDLSCLAPEVVEFTIPLRVEGQPLDARLPGPADGDGVVDRATGGRSVMAGGGGSDRLATLLAERGLLFVFGVVFLAGLALNLTPCVYPMIPITIGFFSGQAGGGGWGRKVSLPALYVLGMALTYSALGVVAGLSGELFGATLQSPWVVVGLITLLIGMSLWMFGFYELRLPGALTRLSGGRTGAIGALVMGLTMGVVAAPCIGPFVVTLLAFISASGDPYLGFMLFFVLALGLGLPFLVLGTFSGALAGLPRSGVWLIYAKKVMGVALLAVALYFLQPFLSDRTLGLTALGFGLVAGLYLGWLEGTRTAAPWFMPLRVVIGLLVVLTGVWLSLPLVRARSEAAWTSYSAAALRRATAEGRPSVIDFFADWCLPCKELERGTFSDPAVLEELERFALFKADLTSFESKPVRELRDRFGVLGVPTIVFIDARGEERENLRLIEFEPPGAFVERLRQVR